MKQAGSLFYLQKKSDLKQAALSKFNQFDLTIRHH